jgi:hypothetical protein
MTTLRPHPEEARSAVSKDGAALWFETRRLRDAPHHEADDAFRLLPGHDRSTLHRPHMPLLAVGQKRAVARDQRRAEIARGRGKNPIGRVAWRLPGQE